MDPRPTNDTTKEIGTADFSNIISAINRDVSLKSFQDPYKTAFGDNSAIQSSRICYTLYEIDESQNMSAINSSICGDFNKARKQKKHRRAISVTDVQPESYKKENDDVSDIQILGDDSDFLKFCKKFRGTMRSLVFIQYFSVVELIRLKLVHPQLNQIFNQDTINISIQIGNLVGRERELYWGYFGRHSLGEVYKM